MPRETEQLRTLLRRLVEGMRYTWRYEMGYPTGYECPACGHVERHLQDARNPDTHNPGCAWAAAARALEGEKVQP